MEARDLGQPLSLRLQTRRHRVSFNGTPPLALTKRQAVSALGSSKLVARMLWASRHAGDRWLVIVRSGRECRAPGLRKNMVRM